MLMYYFFFCGCRPGLNFWWWLNLIFFSEGGVSNILAFQPSQIILTGKEFYLVNKMLFHYSAVVGSWREIQDFLPGPRCFICSKLLIFDLCWYTHSIWTILNDWNVNNNVVLNSVFVKSNIMYNWKICLWEVNTSLIIWLKFQF